MVTRFGYSKSSVTEWKTGLNVETQKSFQNLKAMTITDFRGKWENAGLSLGQTSLQN